MKNTVRLLHVGGDDSVSMEELVGKFAEEDVLCEVVQAEEGPAFGATLDGGPFDVILAHYPGSSSCGLGMLAVARIKCPDVPLIVISEVMHEQRAIEELNEGAVDYILKEHPARLFPSIKRALREASYTEKIRQAERLQIHARILDSIAEGVVVTDGEGVITYINRSTCSMFGYQAEELLGRHVDILNASSLHRTDAFVRELIEHIEKSGSWSGEFYNIRKDGTRFYSKSRITLVQLEGKQHFISAQEDITGRKEAEHALRQSELKFRTLCESAPVGIYLADAEGRNVYTNPCWLEITGLSLEEALDEGWSRGVHPDDLPDLLRRWNEAIASGGKFRSDLRLLTPEGKAVWVRALSTPLLSSDGSITGYVGIVENINERKQAEEEILRLNQDLQRRLVELQAMAGEREQARALLQKAHDQLEKKVVERTSELAKMVGTLEKEIKERRKTDKALRVETLRRIRTMEELREKDRMLLQQTRQAAMGEMISNIAHQWRQPLNVVGLIVQELPYTYEAGDLNGEHLDARVAKAMNLITHMSRTIDDFRNFFKPDKEKKLFHVSKVIQRMLSLVEESFNRLEIRIEVAITGEPVVNGYPNEFSQALLNILENAKDVFVERQAGRPWIVTIRLSVRKGRAVVTITDNAGGIPAEIIDKIFDPYFTTKTPDKGTGVGLFMAKTIITKNMNGALTARNVKHGAEFRIEV